MHRIDSDTAIAVIPSNDPVGAAGFFTKGTPGPGTPVPATNLTQDWCNAIQEEIAGIILSAGIALDKTKNNQLLAAIQKLQSIKLSANTAFYVRTDGDDANTGLANTAGGAFLTLQHALDVVSYAYNVNSFQVTINVGTGTFAGGTLNAAPAGFNNNNPIIINGNGAANTVFNSTVAIQAAAVLQLQNLKISGGSTPGVSANSSKATLILGAGLEFGTITGATNAHIYASSGSISITANYLISGGAAYHYLAYGAGGGIGLPASITVTLTGTPAFSVFASGDIGGVINVNNIPALMTFAGAATGQRYFIDNMTVIISHGSIGAGFFPGNAAGVNNGHGAQYN